MAKKSLLFLMTVVLLCAIGGNVSAQDFGFGFDDEPLVTGSYGFAPSVTIGGEASAAMVVYIDDFIDEINKVDLGDIFTGRLTFSARASIAEAYIGINLVPKASPVSIDEAYVRAWFGDFEVEAGLRKLSWGKADTLGPLDVINPLDYSNLTNITDTKNLKIARPMFHLSYRIGSFSKIEGVFVPSFEPLRYATEGRWVPSQMAELIQLQSYGITPDEPDLSKLNYAQAGLRFTTTIGSADIGVQYYYGRLTRPAVAITYAPPMPPFIPVPYPTAISFEYNPYHQIGVDWAQVLFGFNMRAELAVNLTNDLKGDDGAVYNPYLAWSFGFDRNLVLGINLNLQCNETIRLMNDKIGEDPMRDIEAGTDMTSTQIIASLSKTFLRDKLEVRAAVIYEIEARDFMIMPSIVWKEDAVSVEISGGFFGGDKTGQFGQYNDAQHHKNNFIKASLTYSF